MLQVFVYGDSLKAQLVAVVVPDPEVLLPWARERNLPQVRLAFGGWGDSTHTPHKLWGSLGG